MPNYVIQYEKDGAFNQGAYGTPRNGFPVSFEEATRYETLAQAEEKAADLRYPDGTGVKIIPVRDLESLTPEGARQRLKSLLDDVIEALAPHDNIKADDCQYEDPQEFWLRPLKKQLEAALAELELNR